MTSEKAVLLATLTSIHESFSGRILPALKHWRGVEGGVIAALMAGGTSANDDESTDEADVDAASFFRRLDCPPFWCFLLPRA